MYICDIVPLCSYNNLHFSTRFWNMAEGICDHSATRVLVRSDIVVGEEVC